MATREELVECGVRLLERDGLSGISLRRIAAAAGVSHGAPRHHFPTYDALLAAIARRGVEDLDAVLMSALIGAPSSAARTHDGSARGTLAHNANRDTDPAAPRSGTAANGGGSDASASPVPPSGGSDAARAAVVAAAHVYIDFARSRPEMFELIHRHDLLDGRGGNLRELTAPWFSALAERVTQAIGVDADPHRAMALWAGVHGLAVFASRRTIEPVAALDPDVTVTRLIDALLGERERV